MTETTVDTITTTIDTYLAMWNEDDEATRARLIATSWAKDGTYVDPVLEAAGHDALSAMVTSVHERFPGQRFRRTTAIDAHHGQARFGWELGEPGGAVTVSGIDVATVSSDGRLRSITGFFGELTTD